MADNVVVTAGTGTTVAADEVVDGTLGTVKVQYVKLMDGTLDGTAKAAIGANGLASDVKAVPADPFGANADAASATGSISAKLRAIATALGVTAFDLGSGTAGSRTLRFFQDTAQWIGGAGAVTSATQRATLASDDPAVAVLGAQADAASATTSIKAALRGIATALGTTALDLGSGTGGSRTLRWILDTAQWVGGSGVTTSATQRVALATDSPGVIPTAAPGTLSASGPTMTAVNPSNYETVAASATAQALGATGATGDFINGLLVVPATTSPGNVLLLDNATSITVFTGGATSVSNLVPFFIPLGMTSVSGAWKVTTGANVSVIGVGKFT
jgi:hypothetical protein